MERNIPKDKEAAIYEAALNEFSVNGYEKGSTNVIVKNSGISKGALFKYFGSKVNIFIYVVEKSFNALEEDMVKQMNGLSNDMFERITQLCKIKLESNTKLAKEGGIVVEAFASEDPEIKKYIEEKIVHYTKVYTDVYIKDIDYSKFKEGIDVNKVFETLVFISEGLQKKMVKEYGSDLQEILDNSDKIYKEMFSYVDVIRSSVYK